MKVRSSPLLQRALRLHRAGRFAEAGALYERLLRTPKRDAQVLNLLGTLCAQTGRLKEALRFLDESLALMPDQPSALINRGSTLRNLHRSVEALASYNKAVALKPDSVEAHHNRGAVLRELKLFDEALHSYDKAIELKPDYAEAYCNRGAVLYDLQRLDDALRSFEKAIALKPDYIEAHANRGAALNDLKRLDEALSAYGKAIALRPGYADVHFYRSILRLLTGDFEIGWLEYEWRQRIEGYGGFKGNKKFAEPLWLGGQDLKGKTILLHAEQGLGDTIQFCRYVQKVRERGPARIILQVQQSLVELMKTLAGPDLVIGANAAPPAFDYQCPLMSLPLVFKTRIDSIPSSSAYLQVSKSKKKQWRTELGAKRGLRIGLVWSGSASHKRDHSRSMTLASLLPLLLQGVEFISLQKEVREDDTALLKAHPEIRDWGDRLQDFADTAALCSLMDVVISVDTSVAHLAGALGRPVWIMLPWMPDWRWLLERSDSPWYPSARLFRQSSRGNWSGVIERVRDQLLRLATSTSSKSALPIPSMQQAVQLHQAGRFSEAAAVYRRIHQVSPKDAQVLYLLGTLCAQMGHSQEALRRLDESLALKPDQPYALINRGNVLKELGQPDDALACYDRAIALKPDCADAYGNRGNVLKDLGRLGAALADYDRVIDLKPAHETAHNSRGILLQKLDRLNDALASYDRAIALNPEYALAFGNRGNVLKEMGRFDEALHSYNKAIALKPDYAAAYNNRGNALRELNRPEEALSSYDRALSLQADYAAAYNNRGTALNDVNRLQEALADFDRAVAFEPNYAAAHWNRGMLHLLIGDYGAGWTGYEWRWKTEGLSNFRDRNRFAEPLWLGEQDLRGKTILLYAEQGQGDTIQFCRYTQKVRECKPAKIILQVQESLVALMETLDGPDSVIGTNAALPAFDYQCPLMSLPLAFKTRIDSIPSTAGYLQPLKSKVKQWRTELGPKRRPRVGLVWSGSNSHKNDRNRSVTLEALLPLLSKEIEFVSLQKEVRQGDAAVLKAHPEIHYFGDSLRDFSDTAALCSLMDVVISVDTSVAHLAGALGKPVWIMLPLVPDWRWLMGRSDSPWYPSSHLFRQSVRGDWSDVIESVRSGLLRLIAAKGTKQA
jgi:tetratricopeptide (TPR) repeat protein/ADP-heptose:LPS heptosyltransferase